MVSPSEMEKSEKGEVRAGMKISSVLPGLSFTQWLSIQLWMSLRLAEIWVQTCVSDGEKERKSWVLLRLKDQRCFNDKVDEIVITIIHHNHNNKDTTEHTVV